MTIQRLKARLGLSQVPENLRPRAETLVRGVMSPQRPSYSTQAGPPLSASGADVILAALAPRALRDHFDGCSDMQLHRYLSAETSKSRKDQNPNIIGKLYKEIRKRKKL